MISGLKLRDAIISGANNILNQKTQIDELNIFPVPDGDTGTNMSMTMAAAAREVALLDENSTVSDVISKTASALLRGARGNSGVILSLLFRGFAKALKECETATASDLSYALECGVDAAYRAVMKPTEGTILTVARVAAEKAKENVNNLTDANQMWEYICEQASLTLEQTPEMLPVLKKAGVVDAGGKGLLVIFEGMKVVFGGGEIIKTDSADTTPKVTVNASNTIKNIDADIEFGYCTEFIVDRDKKIDRDPLRLRAYLETIGDCVVVVDDEEIIKVHVHTNDPGNAIQSALKYGQLMNIKIDNMRLQHSNAEWVKSDDEQTQAKLEKQKPVNDYGFVSVSSGAGMQNLFNDLGVDQIVRGGQTMNPSTEDILEAVLATPAKTVFVLPNNKNIIMAAEQVIPLCPDREVRVLQTKTIPQGLTAILNFEPSLSPDENHTNMRVAYEKVATAQVTFAARDSHFEGHSIKEGQILGLENGKVTLTDTDPVKAAYRVARHLFKKGHNQFATIIFGEGITQAQAEKVSEMLTAKFDGDIDITVVDGGQPVYYFIISIE